MTLYPTSVPGAARPGSLVPGSDGAASPSAGWPSCFTYNFCPNPSVEVSTAGYAALLGTEQIGQDNVAYAGSQSLMVTTPGSVPGEGASTPQGTVISSVTGSASVCIFGETGTLTVQAVQNPGGQILGTMQVVLDGSDWQRVELDNLGLVANDTLQLLVCTTTTQALTFWIDAVQYEPESPSHPYIDGDSLNCTWTGTPGLSASYQQYQNPVTASGSMQVEGEITITAMGEVFVIGTVSGQMDMSGDQFQMAAVSGTRTVIPPAIDPGVAGLPWEISGGGAISSSGLLVVSPGSGFSDFAIFTSADPDPAMTLIGWNNAGTENAADTATAYTQLFGTFSAPQQSLDSNGHARWQAAAYMAAGFRIASQPAWAAGTPGTVNFAQVQVEKSAQQGPSAYQLPRSLSTIIKPTRMNYCPNPSFETTGANWDEYWTAIGSPTLAQYAGGYTGSYSMEVSVTAEGGGVYVTIPDLILGDTFIASAYVQTLTANIQDITMSVGGQSASAGESAYPYGSGTYGTGPYGGIAASSAALTTGAWDYRPWVSFAAPASTCSLSFVPTLISGGSYPATFLIDCVLVEPGEVLNPYADGTTDGWAWEAGGTPGLTRSYYYERESVGVNAVQSVLVQHIPLGLTAYAPEYFTPPTQ